MNTVVRCPQGHQWAVHPEGGDQQPRASCPVCGARVEGLVDSAIDTLVVNRGSGEPALPQAMLTNSPPEAAAAAPLPASAPRQVGSYEVLEILGRGGMGIVYKAFQPALKRIVAIKMLLEAAADDSALARFRTEAEAIAQLQHPNIVQIHEIGEHIGRRYLVLEYVDGGTLSRRLSRGLPLAREAAQMVETLARAMHVAHQLGIIHRDLKPGNILLNHDGQPKISDFGLAKRDHRPGSGPNTQTGEVLGTPSYMAPEQASGQVRLIGPATDVYALGAILYEMLTGQPPFDAPTAMMSLHRVLHDEPIRPTKLQARVPRDLETICLTCLEKKPQRRYDSADALADDLRAFLAGDAIRARPPSTLERLAQWARHRPTAAALLAIGIVAFIGLLIGAWQHNAVAVAAVAVLSLLLAAAWYNARLQTALRELAHEHRQAEHNVERMHFLLEATRRLMAAPDVNAVLAILGETSARLVNAERATIYVVDLQNAELWSRIAMGDGVGEIRVPLGTGIAGMVGLTGETINLDDPYQDPRFNPEIDRRTGYRTRNMLAMPLRSAKGPIIGVFQLLNKREGNFGREEEEVLTTLAASAAVALERATR
jgi:serine/threonine-protein kinase